MEPEALEKVLLKALKDLHVGGWAWASAERWHLWTKILLRGENLSCTFQEWDASMKLCLAAGKVDVLDPNMFQLRAVVDDS